MLLALMLMTCPVMAQSSQTDNHMAKGGVAYRGQDYHKAIGYYKQALSQGVSYEAYFNLGNAYYRVDSIPQAIIAYERAQRLASNPEHVAHNLQLAREKTQDRLPAFSQSIVMQPLRLLANGQSLTSWAVMSLLAFALVLVLASVFLFGSEVGIRKVGFAGMLVSLAGFIFLIGMSIIRSANIHGHDSAVVISASAPVRATPQTSEQTTGTIHAGTKVRIADDALAGWLEVSLSDGRTGWIESRHVEVI